FIAGVTGSGKTTTCHKLLSQAKMPFLVIEPAKTEYRTLINGDVSGTGSAFKDIVVFTLGNETASPFRINPFELIPGEVISSHIDMVKATFTSAFPMEASMPQILEEAIYRCYEKKGWNIDTNENDSYGDAAFDADTDSFPILSELLTELDAVVGEKGFGAELAANYKGSLVSRLSNLTVGSKGAMLNCAHSTDFNYIAEHNVILEMEELKSPEDKSLLMGFVLSRLSAVIKAKHKENPDYRHLTLIEEAHRLLSKVEFGDSGSKKGAVETFTDLLAEVRKYGEGLIVVDQIPNKLAPEVLKNTNTKIIHKILAKDDKEAVGDTMLMDDKQKEYLSALETGNAVVFNEHTDKPVHVFITRITDTNESEIGDEVVRARFIEKRPELGKCYDDLEILPLYKLYDTVATSIAKNDPDSAACEQLKKAIEEVSRKTGPERKKIWTLLIRRRELLKSKAINNSKEDTEKRIAELLDFFTGVLDKKNITKDDISGSIILYLK
ncbi:MAG: ATP-binding protein, partial [Treponema sp.]